MGRLTRAALNAELMRRRQASALAQITPDLLAAGHVMQLAILLSTTQNLILQCSRRAGKTWVCLCLLLLTATSTSNVCCIYLGLDKTAVEDQWIVWLRLLGSLGIVAHHANMVTTFANGSYIEFGGLDDKRHVESFRGRNMSGGMAVIDESQSDPGVIEYTATEIFGHMLDETTAEHPVPGRLVISGTIPDVEGVGYFERLWLENFGKEDTGWECFQWSRFDNPHETKNHENLAAYCKKYKYEPSDTYIQRTWFGIRVFGDAKTCYGWRLGNSYKPKPPPWAAGIREAFKPGIIMVSELPPGTRFIASAVDPGTRDEASVEAWAFGAPGGGVWHFFEWITPKNADAGQADWMAVLAEIKRRHPGVTFLQPFYDIGAQEVIDTAVRDYGIGVVLPAKKAALKGQVDRFKNLLRVGEAHVMEGSAMEHDLQVTQWDNGEREKGRWKFSAQHHPCGSESGRYALDHYFATKLPEAPPQYASEIEAQGAKVAAHIKAKFDNWKPNTKPQRNKPDLWGRGWRPR